MHRDQLPAVIGFISLGLAIVLPLLTVLPFGWLWLWQNGYLPYWLIGTFAISVLIFAARFALLRQLRSMTEAAVGQSQKPNATTSASDDLAASSPREAAAMEAVEALVTNVDPRIIESREDVVALGLKTVEAVASQMHPNVKDPVWAFTVPEALALIERVTQKLRPVFSDSIPLGDRLTVGQVIQVYRWRSYLDIANKAYDLWRIIRMANPLAAATQELRERMSKAAIEGLREDLARRLVSTYVREVGRAAIDLYSGRLRVSEDELRVFVSDDENADGAEDDHLAEPLRILIAGQQGSGRSSLINALAGEVSAAVDPLPSPPRADFKTFKIEHDMFPQMVVLESGGLRGDGADLEALADHAKTSDLVVWVVAANQADRDLDRRGLDAIRAAYHAEFDRRPPPIVVVASKVDRLRPVTVWEPPYDLDDGSVPKAVSIRSAVLAISRDLGVQSEQVVPVCFVSQTGLHNIDAVWARLAQCLPEAKSARLLRCLQGAQPQGSWRKLGSQIFGAGRLAARAVSPGSKP